MNWLYLRILKKSSEESKLLKKDFDKALTIEWIQFLKDHWILCKRLPLPELWGWFEIPFLFKLIWPFVNLLKLVRAFLYWLIKKWTESKSYWTYEINLIYETQSIDNINYNTRLLEVYNYGITLLCFLKEKYSFLNFSIIISCGFSKIHHRNIINLDSNKQWEFNINRLKFYLSRVNLISRTERRISMNYFLIKDVTSKIEYLEDWWIMWSGKSKIKYRII